MTFFRRHLPPRRMKPAFHFPFAPARTPKVPGWGARPPTLLPLRPPCVSGGGGLLLSSAGGRAGAVRGGAAVPDRDRRGARGGERELQSGFLAARGEVPPEEGHLRRGQRDFRRRGHGDDHG